MIFVLFYSVFTSRVDFDVQSSQNLQNSILLANIANKLINKFPFVEWISGALIGDWLSILFMTLLFCLVVFVLIPLTAPVYIRTLNGFMDVRTKKLTESQVKGVLKREVKAASITRALFFRDVKTVFREPAFFSNGPLAIVLLPAIFVISFIAGFHGTGRAEIENLKFNIDVFFLSADFTEIEKIKYYIVLGAAAVTIFLANSANVASTSFSREGKSFYCLKAMPIKNDTIVFVKFLHAFLYTIVAFIIVAPSLAFAENYLGLPFLITEKLCMFLAIFVIEIVVSLLLIFIDIFMDTVHPKLDWENPIAAFKRNFNTFLSIIITVGVVAVFLFLGIVVIPKNTFGLIIITLVFLAIAAPLGSCYWKYAIKKIDRL
jgi:ABC-2 type transport system permease protein